MNEMINFKIEIEITEHQKHSDSFSYKSGFLKDHEIDLIINSFMNRDEVIVKYLSKTYICFMNQLDQNRDNTINLHMTIISKY